MQKGSLQLHGLAAFDDLPAICWIGVKIKILFTLDLRGFRSSFYQSFSIIDFFQDTMHMPKVHENIQGDILLTYYILGIQ